MTALAAAAPLRPRAVRAALPGVRGEAGGRFKARPFDLAAVRLRPGAALEALETNRRYLTPTDGRPLEFRTRGQKDDLTLIPLNRVFDERYAVYFKVIET